MRTLRNIRKFLLGRRVRGLLSLCLVPTFAFAPGSLKAFLIHEHGENDSHTHLMQQVGDVDSWHREHAHLHINEAPLHPECESLVEYQENDKDRVFVILAGPLDFQASIRTKTSGDVPSVLPAHSPAKAIGTHGEFFGLSPPSTGGTSRPISHLSGVASILASNHALLI